MDDKDEIHLRLRISKLEAKLELCEIERADLKRVLNAPGTSSEGILHAMRRANELTTECTQLCEELKQVRSSCPQVRR